MEFKYKIEVKATIHIDGIEVADVYEEEGSGPLSKIEDLEEYMDMYFKPRIGAAGFVLKRRMYKSLSENLNK